MKVALYYPWVYLHGGPERTIAELLSRTRHSWTIFTNRYEPESTFPELKNAEIVQLSDVPVKRTFRHAAAAAFRIATQKLPLQEHKALVVFCEGLGDLAVIRNTDVPLACLCFTPLRAAFDPYYQQRNIEMNSGAWWRGPVLRIGAKAFRALDRVLWKRYQTVWAISREVRKRITDHNLFPDDRIEVFYPGVSVASRRPSGEYSTDFLIPGRIMWTKNLELAIQSLHMLHARRPDLRRFTLTLAGYVDEKSRPYLAKLKSMAGDGPEVRFIVAPDDHQLLELTKRAYTVLYTPFNEDWGLAPLEAMALEKPVIAVNRGGPAESILHGETGLLVDSTPEAFSAAMEAVADNPNRVREMGQRARLRAREFEWDHFAQKIDDAVERLAGSTDPKSARVHVEATHK